MLTSSRFIPIACCAAVAATLAGCTINRTVLDTPTVATYPAVVMPAPIVVTPAPTVVTPAPAVIVR